MISIFGFQISVIDLIGAIIGLFYVVSEYRAGRWFWPLCLLMSAFYIYIDFSSGYYANGSICIYNFIMSIYGILVWRGLIQSKDKTERPFGSCPLRNVPWIVLVVAVLSVVLWWLLQLLGEGHEGVDIHVSAWLDGISSALTIVGMWMLSQKWWQQWICWMVVNPIMMVLFWMSGNYASAVLYVVFEVFCILGVLSWRRKALADERKEICDE